MLHSLLLAVRSLSTPRRVLIFQTLSECQKKDWREHKVHCGITDATPSFAVPSRLFTSTPSPALERQLAFLTPHGSAYDYAFFPPSGRAIGLVLPHSRESARTLRTSLMTGSKGLMEPSSTSSFALKIHNEAQAATLAGMLAETKEMIAFEGDFEKRRRMVRTQLAEEYGVDLRESGLVKMVYV